MVSLKNSLHEENRYIEVYLYLTLGFAILIPVVNSRDL